MTSAFSSAMLASIAARRSACDRSVGRAYSGHRPDIDAPEIAQRAGAPLTIDRRMDTTAPAEPAALLEREHEVERVRSALQAVARNAGGVLLIEGAAGIGKSRLLEGARVRASELGIRVLSARATELEQGFPFGVMRQLFERSMLEADADERDRWLAGAAALAADVITGPPTTPAMAPGTGPSAGDPGYVWHHGLYWLASNLAADSPLALVVDDLQWCDAPSASVLAFIARRLEGQGLALILATRPLDPALMPEAASLAGDPAVELVRPSALTPAAVGTLVAARLTGEADERFVHACLEVTGGNPFLVSELLAEATARGLEPTATAAAEVGAIVPRGVANAVLLRLARHGTAAAQLARAVSVLGDNAQVGDAALLSGVSGAELEAAMAALVSAGVVESGGHRALHPPHPARRDLRRLVTRRTRADAPRRSDDPARARRVGRPGRSASHAHRPGRRP